VEYIAIIGRATLCEASRRILQVAYFQQLRESDSRILKPLG
jgi:hypothetical protein